MSLRRSLILLFSVLLTILAVVASGFSYYSARNEAWGILDFQLRQIALVVGDGGSLAPAEASVDASDEAVAVRIRYREPAASVTNDASVPFPEEPAAGFSVFTGKGEEWRLYAEEQGARTVMVAQRTAERNELAADAAWNSAWPFLLGIPLSWLAVHWLVGAVIDRLGRLTSEVETRAPEDTGHLQTHDVPVEVRPLILAINRAFDRVRQSLDQQRAFIADAAHELRTPVAALALQVHNLKQASTAIERNLAIADIEAGIRRAMQTTSLLLRLAGSELRRPDAMPSLPIDLANEVRECIGRFLAVADLKGIDLGLLEVVQCPVRVEPADLAAVLDAVVDNALRYTPAGGCVDVSVLAQENTGLVIVSDDGPGIPEHLRTRVFDRFFRIDPSIPREADSDLPSRATWLSATAARSGWKTTPVVPASGSSSRFRPAEQPS